MMPPQTTAAISTRLCPHRSPKRPKIHAEAFRRCPTTEMMMPVSAAASLSLMAEMLWTKYGKIGAGADAAKLIRQSVSSGTRNDPIASSGRNARVTPVRLVAWRSNFSSVPYITMNPPTSRMARRP